MINEMRCSPMLSGHQGSAALDRAAVATALTRLALLDVISPEVREVDLDPLIVGESGAFVTAARVRLATPDEPPGRRDSANDDYQRSLSITKGSQEVSSHDRDQSE